MPYKMDLMKIAIFDDVMEIKFYNELYGVIKNNYISIYIKYKIFFD